MQQKRIDFPADRSEITDFPADNNVGKGYNIAKAFVYFVRSGRILIHVGKLTTAGIDGFNWPSTAAVSTSDIPAAVHHINFSNKDVYPSGVGYRWYGIPLRCLKLIMTT